MFPQCCLVCEEKLPAGRVVLLCHATACALMSPACGLNSPGVLAQHHVMKLAHILSGVVAGQCAPLLCVRSQHQQRILPSMYLYVAGCAIVRALFQ
jgi:hypothetical protein